MMTINCCTAEIMPPACSTETPHNVLEMFLLVWKILTRTISCCFYHMWKENCGRCLDPILRTFSWYFCLRVYMCPETEITTEADLSTWAGLCALYLWTHLVTTIVSQLWKTVMTFLLMCSWHQNEGQVQWWSEPWVFGKSGYHGNHVFFWIETEPFNGVTDDIIKGHTMTWQELH